ncbi:UNVERIFIED_CONTAM: hypothetical protein Sradi_3795600, partial [Sesamum radiatum]
MIRLESSGSCQKARQNILEISWDENEMSKNPLILIIETNKFNGTNYNDWLRNLRIILDFENQGYVLDKPLPTALPEGFSPEERLTFEKRHKDNRKIRSTILASITNEIQKQYDRLENVSLDNAPHERVLVGETSTSKAKDKVARRWKRKKGKKTTITATASTRGAPPAAPKGMGKGKVGGSQQSKANDVCMIAKKRGIGRGSVTTPLQPRIRRLVDSKSLEIDDLDHLPTCESCLKGKMTKKPFVGQSGIANGVLDLVHTDVYGLLSIPLEEDSLLHNLLPMITHMVSSWDSTTQLVAERRNGTLFHMVRSMMSFTELPPSFWGYALETAAKLLNITPSKSVIQTPHEIWHYKPVSYKYLKVWGSPAYVKRLVGDKLDSRSSLCRFIGYPKETAGYYFYDPAEQKIFIFRNTVFLEKYFPSNNRRDEVLIEESSEEPQHDSTTSFKPTVHTDGVPILRRSTRESRVPERYGFVRLTSQLDNDPKTYGKVMSDIDSDKWFEAMKSEMDSMVQI